MIRDNKAAYECQSTDFILMAEKRYKRYRESIFSSLAWHLPLYLSGSRLAYPST